MTERGLSVRANLPVWDLGIRAARAVFWLSPLGEQIWGVGGGGISAWGIWASGKPAYSCHISGTFSQRPFHMEHSGSARAIAKRCIKRPGCLREDFSDLITKALWWSPRRLTRTPLQNRCGLLHLSRRTLRSTFFTVWLLLTKRVLPGSVDSWQWQRRSESFSVY